jgi:AraC-like DNA-binding protein
MDVMKMEKFEPSEILKPFVDDFMVIESHHEMTNRILPGTSLVMAFRFKGITFSDGKSNSSIPAFSITGITKTYRIIQYSNDTGVLLVRFKEGGAAAFLSHPLHEMAGHSTPLDQLFANWKIRRMEEELSNAITNKERIAVVENFLLSNIKFETNDVMVNEALKLIESANGNFKSAELVLLLNTNVNSFEKKFRSRVGIGPKHFSSIVRLKTAIKNYTPGKDLTQLSYEAGFFDQSHFIKYFKSFTGENPTHFFKKGIYW